MPSTSTFPTYPATGNRHFKYRVIERPMNDRRAQEDALNKFAGFGYRLKSTRFDEEAQKVIYTFERRTRRMAGAVAAPKA